MIKEIVSILLMLFLSGCVNDGTPQLAETHSVGFENIKDIPMPSSIKIDLKHSVVVGPKDAWLGRLVYTSNKDAAHLIDFYTKNFPSFGWKKISVTRGENSILVYERDNRIITINIQMPENLFSYTYVRINMNNIFKEDDVKHEE